MPRSFALLGCLLLASCGGDPSVEALRSFLRAEAAAPTDAPSLEQLNRTFASEAIRSGAVASELTLDGRLYSPVVIEGRDDERTPVDVRAWRDRGLIDREGRLSPTRPGPELALPPVLAELPGEQTAARARLLYGAMLLLAPELERVAWSNADAHAIRFSADRRSAQVNPRLLLLLPDRADAGTLVAALEPLDPALGPELPTGPEAGFHSEIETGNDCLDTLFLVLLAPAWIAWHIGDLCGFGLCSAAGPLSGAPSPLLALGMLPALLALTLARRRR